MKFMSCCIDIESNVFSFVIERCFIYDNVGVLIVFCLVNLVLDF